MSERINLETFENTFRWENGKEAARNIEPLLKYIRYLIKEVNDWSHKFEIASIDLGTEKFKRIEAECKAEEYLKRIQELESKIITIQDKEMKEYRDMFFNSETSWRDGYGCGMSDMHIKNIGNVPPGEEARWKNFQIGLKSWEPKELLDENNNFLQRSITVEVKAGRGQLEIINHHGSFIRGSVYTLTEFDDEKMNQMVCLGCGKIDPEIILVKSESPDGEADETCKECGCVSDFADSIPDALKNLILENLKLFEENQVYRKMELDRSINENP